MSISNLFGSLLDFSVPTPPPNSDGTKSFQEMSQSELESAMEGYYKKAQDGDTEDIPTEALQAMASDSKCDEDAYENIAQELDDRNEPMEMADPYAETGSSYDANDPFAAETTGGSYDASDPFADPSDMTTAENNPYATEGDPYADPNAFSITDTV